MRMLVKMPSLTNVAAGSTATLNCPIGRSYDRIIFEHNKELTVEQIKNLRVEIDGKPIQEYKDVGQLQAINNYYKRYYLAGAATINDKKFFSIYSGSTG